MTAVNGTTIKTEFKTICERVINGETFIVTRPGNQNVVILSEREYQQLLRAKAYADHLGNTIPGSSAEATYPPGFFDLFGAGSSIELDIEPDELSFSKDVKREKI